MNYVKGILSGLAAIFIAESVGLRSIFRVGISEHKATGLGAIVGGVMGSAFSPLFWTLALVLFALFFAASRLENKTLRAILFWIPDCRDFWVRHGDCGTAHIRVQIFQKSLSRVQRVNGLYRRSLSVGCCHALLPCTANVGGGSNDPKNYAIQLLSSPCLVLASCAALSVAPHRTMIRIGVSSSCRPPEVLRANEIANYHVVGLPNVS
jgi:hypothetical protein